LSNWKRSLRDSQLAAIVRMRWQRPDRGGSVYLIRIGDVVKIGRSVNPDLRIKQMQLPQSPDSVAVVHCNTYPETIELETLLHQRYEAQRRFGEWFALTPEQVLEARRFASDWVAERG